ncbi:putative RNA helicase [Giardia muris]|uniref:Putative RNA helicase n=1 Tax=Giardia muris TaxID=5742 RepID=A0A4Z1SQG2_GIAMU|nr:putative RNA helicase [Giardia muris]|eukprot:TNJ28094.1 putative RNA helicase [Giardia muris]
MSRRRSSQQTISQARTKLPIYPLRDAIVNAMINGKHRVTIVAGATGSGKSTQLPQYLHEGGYIKSRLTITQPRRVAAISLASYVAREQKTTLGKLVGYSVRFDDKTTPGVTKIRYATDGTVVREALLDQSFRSDSIIIVDEAHERSVNTDLLLGLLKVALGKNPNLRVVIMSATLNAQVFATFFGTESIYVVQGRQFPIHHHFTLEPERSYQDGVIACLQQICETEPKGNILVFLPGEHEITSVLGVMQHHCQLFDVLYTTSDDELDSAHIDDDQTTNSLLTRLKHDDGVDGREKVILPEGAKRVQILPLYANLSLQEQVRVFEPTPSDVRRIILATNIAETSITVPDIRYVIDCGYTRQKVHHSRLNLSSLVTVPCSRASVMQRAGRAGRVMEGHCYHIYTYETFCQLEKHDTPELLRTYLMPVYLIMLACGITNPMAFDFPSPPPLDAQRAAIERLAHMGCLDISASLVSVEQGLKLSTLGKDIVRFPTDPEMAVAILAARSFEREVVESVIGLVALLSGDLVYISVSDPELQKQSRIAQSQFSSHSGDHIMLLNVWNAYRAETQDQVGWCKRHFLSHRCLSYAEKVYTQLLTTFDEGFSGDEPQRKTKIKQFSSETCTDQNVIAHVQTLDLDSKVLYCFCRGYGANVGRLGEDRRTYSTSAGDARIHPSSCLRSFPAVVLFHEIVRTSSIYMRMVSEVPATWVM